MPVTALNHYAEQANLTTGSPILRPGKQQGGHYLRVSAPYVFWLLLYVASFTATGRADQSYQPENGTECDKRGQIITYTQQVEVYKGPTKEIQTVTVTCTCIAKSTPEGGDEYEWDCE
jgi:hypothetical protein